MKRLAVGALVAAMFVGSAVPAAEAKGAERPAVNRVLVVSVPRLTWKVVADAQPPVLMELLRRSAVASMSVRSISARTTLGEGYATIGAGNRASVSEKRNRSLLYGAHLGELGNVLRDHQHVAAVIADADHGENRDAVFAVMDHRGRVQGGSVSTAVLDQDRSAFQSAWSANDVVLFELSDLERADAYGHHQEATLRRDDALLGRILGTVDPARTLVIVVTPAPPRAAEQLGVWAMAGPGVQPGSARSATTRRSGYVTLPDVAPTILSALRLPIPNAMTGTPITSSGGGAPSVQTARRFATDNARAMFRDRATGPVSVMFVVFQVLVYAACVAALARRWRAGATAAVAYLALVVLALPLLVFMSGLVDYTRLGVPAYSGLLLSGAALLAVAAWRLGRRQLLFAPGALIGATLAMLLVDVMIGGRLQLNTVFGYSPIVAGRFSGYGNLAYGLLAMSAIVTATIAWSTLEGRPLRGWVAGGVLLAALAVDGAPPWGSDVGGVMASGPAFVVVGTLLRGPRVDWRRWAVAVVGTLAAVTGFALVDLARPASSRTHLGRLVTNPGDLNDVVHRKLMANLHILTSSVWTLIIPVALGFMIFLAMRPPTLLQRIQRKVPALRACLFGGLLAGLLGFATNDSGVAVPAMMLAVLLPYLTYLLTRTAHE